MAVRPRGKKWQADVKDLDGQRIRLSFDTEEAARAWLDKASKYVEEGKPAPTKEDLEATLTLYSYYMENRADIWDEVNETVLSVGRSCLEYFGANTKLDDITTPFVNQAISKMRKNGLQPSTINSRLSWISKLLKYAKEMDDLKTLPSIKRKKIGASNPRFLMPEEETQIRTWYRHHGLEDEWMYIQFLLYTGARFSEPLHLTNMHVSKDAVTFPKTKAGIRRTVPLTPKSRESLTYFLHKRSNNSIFGVIEYWSVNRTWRRLRRHMDKEHDKSFTIHILRHTCASRLVQKGVDLRRVMEWMGHADIKTTLIYANLAPRDLDVAAKALEDF